MSLHMHEHNIKLVNRRRLYLKCQKIMHMKYLYIFLKSMIMRRKYLIVSYFISAPKLQQIERE